MNDIVESDYENLDDDFVYYQNVDEQYQNGFVEYMVQGERVEVLNEVNCELMDEEM